MLKINDSVRLGAGPIHTPTVVEGVSTDHYAGCIGDIIEIIPNLATEIQRVLVAIETPDNKQVEHGLAVWNDKKNIWEYTATVAYPVEQGVNIAVTAVGAPGHNTTTIDLQSTPDVMSITYRCGGEMHSAWYSAVKNPNSPSRKRRSRRTTTTTANSSTASEPPASTVTQ